MTALHEAEVAARFDLLHARFKASVPPDDVRLRAIIDALAPLRGKRVLDLGCGKGRFAAHLEAEGAEVIGLDRSAAMLAGARSLPRVLASAHRLPFAASSFDAVVAVEVFEHLAEPDGVLAEVRRVLRPGGVVAIVDKNAASLNAKRPWLPNAAVKRIDEWRGLWMYPPGGPVRERWFRPAGLRAQLGRHFVGARVRFLLSPEEEERWIFRLLLATRKMTLWTARSPGADDE